MMPAKVPPCFQIPPRCRQAKVMFLFPARYSSAWRISSVKVLPGAFEDGFKGGFVLLGEEAGDAFVEMSVRSGPSWEISRGGRRLLCRGRSGWGMRRSRSKSWRIPSPWAVGTHSLRAVEAEELRREVRN